jgi:hypothetical protein
LPGNLWPKITLLLAPTHLTLPCLPRVKTKLVTLLRSSRQNRRRCWISSKNTTSRKNLKMAEALGTVHMRGWRILQGWWWPVGPKLIFDQMWTPALEIIDGSVAYSLYNTSLSQTQLYLRYRITTDNWSLVMYTTVEISHCFSITNWLTSNWVTELTKLTDWLSKRL